MVVIYHKFIKYKYNNRQIPHSYSQFPMRFLHIMSMSIFVKQSSECLLFFYYHILVFVTTCFSVYDTFLKELEREVKITEREGWQTIKWQLSDEGSCLETVFESHFFEEGLSINLPLLLSCLLHHPNVTCEE